MQEIVMVLYIFRIFQNGWLTCIVAFENTKTQAYIKMMSLLFCVKIEKACSMITFEIKLCADRKLGRQEHKILFKAFVQQLFIIPC